MWLPHALSRRPRRDFNSTVRFLLRQIAANCEMSVDLRMPEMP
jgi:hypothetical protein